MGREKNECLVQVFFCALLKNCFGVSRKGLASASGASSERFAARSTCGCYHDSLVDLSNAPRFYMSLGG